MQDLRDLLVMCAANCSVFLLQCSGASWLWQGQQWCYCTVYQWLLPDGTVIAECIQATQLLHARSVQKLTQIFAVTSEATESLTQYPSFDSASSEAGLVIGSSGTCRKCM